MRGKPSTDEFTIVMCVSGMDDDVGGKGTMERKKGGEVN